MEFRQCLVLILRVIPVEHPTVNSLNTFILRSFFPCCVLMKAYPFIIRHCSKFPRKRMQMWIKEIDFRWHPRPHCSKSFQRHFIPFLTSWNHYLARDFSQIQLIECHALSSNASRLLVPWGIPVSSYLLISLPLVMPP